MEDCSIYQLEADGMDASGSVLVAGNCDLRINRKSGNSLLYRNADADADAETLDHALENPDRMAVAI